jgi:predicted DNA-binding transcriptional regulator YafY
MADRVERLTNLLALLLETPRPLTLVEIAGEMEGQYPDKEGSRRAAFERDKAALRDIGVPIESEVLTGPRAGMSAYWIDRTRYELAELELEPDETRALQVAVAAARTGSAWGMEALWKLGASGEAAGGVDDVLGGATVSATVPELDALPVLRDAAARRAAVTFEYHDTRRRLDPYGLLLRGGFWYLVGHDADKGEQRTYRVDRIDGDVVAGPGGTFERPAGFDLQAAFPADPKLLGGDRDAGNAVARVRIDGPRAVFVERELGAERVRRRLRNGSIEVDVPCANVVAFRSWVLGLGEHAVVLGPRDVRQHVVDWLTGVAGRGSGRSGRRR